MNYEFYDLFGIGINYIMVDMFKAINFYAFLFKLFAKF